MSRMTRGAWHLAASALVAAVLAACNDASSPSATLTQPQADALAEQVTTDAAALPEGATYNGSTGVPLSAGPMTSAQLAPAAAAACTPAKSPASPTNSDADAVPDSVRFDFAGCTFTSGSFAVTLAGTIDFVDPTATTTDRAIRTRYTSFSRSITNTSTSKTRSMVENGVRTATGTPNQLQLTETDFRTDYTFADGSSASHVRTWSATFNVDAGGSIQVGSPLPSGNWDITGTSSWTMGQASYSISVTTNPQLHYNPSCSVSPRFDSGTLSAVVTKNSVTTNVTVQFTACGQYTVTRS